MTEQRIEDMFEDDISDSEFAAILKEQEESTNNDSQFVSVSEEESPTLEHLKILKKFFGHSSFRPLQWKIINSLLKDRRDNFTIMSTGYGKSLCYQYPAVFSKQITLVVSPLISLMEDQVLSLNVANIKSCLLGSAQKEKKKVIDEIFQNEYLIIYLTPEFICGDYGSEILTKMKELLKIGLIAIDEAHCISSWGHDFRHTYRKLGNMRSFFPNTPFLAVTATATKIVQDDIIKSLSLRNPQILHSGFDRPNLYIEVSPKSQYGIDFDFKKVMDRVGDQWKFPGPTIIYCLTRKMTETVEEFLKSKDINCAAYHAGKSFKDRKLVHELFLKDQIDVIVATTAFGMGIDKPDIRCVFHYGTPGSIEGYYQEIGRAGRDGDSSRCILVYDDSDFKTHQFLGGLSKARGQKNRTNEKLANIRKFLVTNECRRKFILSYFGDELKDINPVCCDICHKKNLGIRENHEGLDSKGLYDFTKDAQIILGTVDLLDGKFGLMTYIQFVRGLKNDKYKRKMEHVLYGCGKNKNEKWWKSFGNLMLQEDYLMKTPVSLNGFKVHTCQLSKKGVELLQSLTNGSGKLVLNPPSDILSQLKPKICSNEKDNNSKLLPDVFEKKENKIEDKLYWSLVEKRNKMAEERECMPHAVISIPDIKELIRVKPKSLQELSSCNFQMFSEIKIGIFGKELIDIIVKELGEKKATLSISEALSISPLPNKFGNSAIVTYNMLKKGLTVEKIAKERNLTNSTITSHLTEAMLTGQPVTLEQLGVDEFTRVSILKISLEGPDFKFKEIKERCPEEITWDQIKIVFTYKKIREHLEEKRFLYEEFEDFSFESLKKTARALDLQGIAVVEKEPKVDGVAGRSGEKVGENEEDLEEFLRLCSDMINDDEGRGVKRKEENKTMNKQTTIIEERRNIDSGLLFDDEVFSSPPRSEFAVDSSKPSKIQKML